MSDSLLVSLLLNISLLTLAATLMMELKPLRAFLYRAPDDWRLQLMLAALFGLLATLSTYCGFNAYGANINTRVISVTAAGLLGGPVAGIGAGLIGGIHRYFYAPGSFTALACSVGTVTFGVIGSMGSRFFRRQPSRLFLVGITVIGELCQTVWLFLLARPVSAVVELELHILLPKLVVNSAGMVLLFSIFSRFRQSRTDEMIESQSDSMYIANQCLPYLREGFGPGPHLQKVADTIRAHAVGYQVLLSDRSRLLAASGVTPGGDALPDYMARCMDSGSTQVRSSGTAQQGRLRLRQEGLVAVPIRCGKEIVGAMALRLDQGGLLLASADIHFAENLAGFLSTLLELNNLDREIELRRQAEFRAFQAQIDPHFFFNALNTISALCRTDPDKARSLLLVLADYYRQTLTINEDFVTLTTELQNVNNYLTIAQARFINAIHFTAILPKDTDRFRMPPLIIQPLVENAVRHGGVSVDDRRVELRIVQTGGCLEIAVTDWGKGFPADVLSSLADPDNKRYSGLFNVDKRLRSVYGAEGRLRVSSTPAGSTVRFTIPAGEAEKEETA